MHQGVLDACISEANRQIGAALPSGYHSGLLEVLEAHVPQPGQVLAVRNPPVDRDDHPVCMLVDHRQRFLPAGRVFGQQDPGLVRADTNGPVASGDLVDLADGGDGHSRIGAEGDCGGHGLGGVAAIHRAWQCQPHRQRQPVGPIQRGVVECIVRPLLGHTPMRGKCLQPQIVDAKLQPAGQLDRAHDEVNREFGLGDLGLRSEKRIVERDIVRDQSAPAQHVDNLTGDIGELWLETLAAHWGVPQQRPHDAFDDVRVLTGILAAALESARELDVWLPVHPVTRRRWPNGRVTHDELRPLKALAARMACPYLNPGRYVQGRPLVQGMRVGLAAEVKRTHEELVERILHAGLAYSDVVDRDTSLVVCNATAPEHGKGYHALQLGVPVMPEARFMECIGAVVGGASVEDFTDVAPVEKQLALF